MVARLNALYPIRLRALRDDCLKTYVELFDTGKRLLPHIVRDIAELPIVTRMLLLEKHSTILVDSWAHLDLAATQHDIARDLRKRVLRWVQQQNLSSTWFLDVVVKMLMVWRLSPETAQRPLFFITGSMSIGRDRRVGYVNEELHRLIYGLSPPRDKFSIPEYNPAMQTRKEHTDEVLAKLRDHQLHKERLFVAAGFSASKAKRPKKGALGKNSIGSFDIKLAKNLRPKSLRWFEEGIQSRKSRS